MSNLIDSGNSTITGTVTIGDGSSLVGLTEDAVIQSGGELSLDIAALTDLKAVDATEKTIVVEAGGKIRTGTSGSYYTIPTDGSYKLRSENIGDAITYDGNTGTVNGETSISVVYASPAGAKTVDPLMVATRSGYIFQSWNTVVGGGGTAYSPSDPITPSVGTNTVLYAQWVLDLPTLRVQTYSGTAYLPSNQQTIAELGNYVYFGVQNQSTFVQELCAHDVVNNTQSLVTSFGVNNSVAGAYACVALDDKIYFRGNNGTRTRLCVYDPSGPSVSIIDVDNDSGTNTHPGSMVVCAGKLYFRAQSVANGAELWRVDPSTDLATRLTDIQAGATSSNVNYLKEHNGVVYFSADNGTAHEELWSFNPTGDVLTKMTDIYPTGNAITRPREDFVVIGTTAYFCATATDLTREVYSISLLGGGPTKVTNINPTGTAYPGGLTIMDSIIYFYATDGGANELWSYDPSGPTTTKLSTSSLDPRGFTVFNSHIYMSGYDSGSGYQQPFKYSSGGGLALAVEVNSMGDGWLQATLGKNLDDNDLYFLGDTGNGYDELISLDTSDNVTTEWQGGSAGSFMTYTSYGENSFLTYSTDSPSNTGWALVTYTAP